MCGLNSGDQRLNRGGNLRVPELGADTKTESISKAYVSNNQTLNLHQKEFIKEEVHQAAHCCKIDNQNQRATGEFKPIIMTHYNNDDSPMRMAEIIK